MKQFQAFILIFVITSSIALCQSVFNPYFGYIEGSTNGYRFNYQRYEGSIDNDSVVVVLAKYKKLVEIEIEYVKEKYSLVSSSKVKNETVFENFNFILSKFNPTKSVKPIKANIKLNCKLEDRLLTGEIRFPDNKTSKLNAKMKFPKNTAKMSFIQFQKNFNAFSQNSLSTEILVPLIKREDSIQSYRINRTIFNAAVGNQIDKYKTNSIDEEAFKYYSSGNIKNLSKEKAQKIKSYEDFINNVIYSEYLDIIDINDSYEREIKEKYGKRDTSTLTEKEKNKIWSAESDNGFSYGMAWNYNVTIEPILNANNILTFANYTNENTGGAHGASSVDFININLHTSNILGMKDIFVKGFHSKLMKITKKRFMAQISKNIKESLSSFMPEYFYSPHFAITKYGLYFHYNNYEIASYVDGQVDIFVPYGDLMELIPKESPIYELAKEHSFENVKKEDKINKK